MKKIAVALVVALSMLAAPAYADDTPKVTKWEYNHVYVGDTKAHVEGVFDNNGVLFYNYGCLSDDYTHIVKSYAPSWTGGSVQVHYKRPCGSTWRWRLAGKNNV